MAGKQCADAGLVVCCSWTAPAASFALAVGGRRRGTRPSFSRRARDVRGGMLHVMVDGESSGSASCTASMSPFTSMCCSARLRVLAR